MVNIMSHRLSTLLAIALELPSLQERYNITETIQHYRNDTALQKQYNITKTIQHCKKKHYKKRVDRNGPEVGQNFTKGGKGLHQGYTFTQR